MSGSPVISGCNSRSDLIAPDVDRFPESKRPSYPPFAENETDPPGAIAK